MKGYFLTFDVFRSRLLRRMTALYHRCIPVKTSAGKPRYDPAGYRIFESVLA